MTFLEQGFRGRPTTWSTESASFGLDLISYNLKHSLDRRKIFTETVEISFLKLIFFPRCIASPTYQYRSLVGRLHFKLIFCYSRLLDLALVVELVH